MDSLHDNRIHCAEMRRRRGTISVRSGGGQCDSQNYA